MRAIDQELVTTYFSLLMAYPTSVQTRPFRTVKLFNVLFYVRLKYQKDIFVTCFVALF
jgi:hypothetical protein